MTVVYEVFNPALERQLGPSGPRKQKPKGGGGGNVARSYAGGVDVLSLVRLRQTAELARAYGGRVAPSLSGPLIGSPRVRLPSVGLPSVGLPSVGLPFPFPVPPLPVLSREAPLHERRREHPREPLPPPVRRRGADFTRAASSSRASEPVRSPRTGLRSAPPRSRAVPQVALQHLRQLRHLRVVVRPQGVHLPERALQRPRRARVGLEVVEGILREERRRARVRSRRRPPPGCFFSSLCTSTPRPGCLRSMLCTNADAGHRARGRRADREPREALHERRRDGGGGARACAGRRPGAGKTRRDRRRETRRARRRVYRRS